MLSFLRNQGVCNRCGLRLTGELATSVYLDAESMQDCTLCFGVLHPSGYIDQITRAVNQSGYKFNSFKFSLLMPLPSMLRQEWIKSICKNHGFDIQRVVEIKDAFKWIATPMFSSEIGRDFSLESPFAVEIAFQAPEAEEELNRIKTMLPKQMSIGNLQKFFASASPERVISMMDSLTNSSLVVSTRCSAESQFVAGNYFKYSRKISQSPWKTDGEFEGCENLQDILSRPILEILQGKSALLHSSGREDVDVRMLGTGRPFLLEITDPKQDLSQLENSEIEDLINSQHDQVKVSGVTKSSKSYLSEITAGEGKKLKAYRALVWVENPELSIESLESIQDLEVKQKTPIRVLHRRSLATREKTVYTMRTERIDEHLFELILRTSGGTYIKEFVHGDLGRTQPNVGSLLHTRADILELDVLGLSYSLEELDEVVNKSWKDN